MAELLSIEYIANIDGFGLPPTLLKVLGISYGKIVKIELEDGSELIHRARPVPFTFHDKSCIVLPEEWKELYNITGDRAIVQKLEPSLIKKVKFKLVESDDEDEFPHISDTLADKKTVFVGQYFRKSNYLIKLEKISENLSYGILSRKTIIDLPDPPEDDSDDYGEPEIDSPPEEQTSKSGKTDNKSDTVDSPWEFTPVDHPIIIPPDFSTEPPNSPPILDDVLDEEVQPVLPTQTGSNIFDPRFPNLSRIKGIDEEIEQLKEDVILPFTENLTSYSTKGVNIGGTLLYGPPGCGKTDIALSIAKDLGIALFKVDLSDFASTLVYGATEKLTNIFRSAANISSGAIIFIDEIDTIAASRESSSSSDKELTNALLQELDPVKLPSHVLVIAATNRLSALDTAVTRSGRFDTKIPIPPPDLEGRYLILKDKLKGVKVDRSINAAYLKSLAKKTVGYVGADLNLLTKKAKRAADKTARKKNMASKMNKSHLEDLLKRIKPLSETELNLIKPRISKKQLPGHEAIIDKIVMEATFQLYPQQFRTDIKTSLSNGILLYGPPGTGKTSIANAVANELNILFLPVRLSEIKSKYVGDTIKNISAMFNKARMFNPILLFFDELDSFGVDRALASQTTDNDTITTLLTEIDGMESNGGIILMGATNRKESIDSALLRPGRFGKHFEIGIPDGKQYARMIEYFINEIPNNLKKRDIDLIIELMSKENMTGADLKNFFEDFKKKLVFETKQGYKADLLDFNKAIENFIK